MLFDHRMQDRVWLKRYTELGRKNMESFLRLAGFEELHYLRRYCAKLIYEVAAYGGEADWDELPDLYVEQLTGADGCDRLGIRAEDERVPVGPDLPDVDGAHPAGPDSCACLRRATWERATAITSAPP